MPAGQSFPISPVLDQPGPGTGSLLEVFAQVPDPRDRRGRRHALPVVLTLTACAMAAGNTSHESIAEWVADAPQELLARVGARWNGWRGRYTGPDGRTVRRVLTLVDPVILDEVTCRFVAGLCRAGQAPERPGLRALAVDGKVLRGSGSTFSRPVMLMAALDHERGTILAQHEIDRKTNEIPELRTLLDPITLTDTVVTLDALHTQRATARYLRRRGAHYVFTVKANQPGLLEACHRRIAHDGANTGEHHETVRGHGRISERHLTTADADGIDWPDAAQIAQIIRYTRDLAGRRIAKEVVYVITSIPPELAGPGELAALVRGHWRIENQSHYVRDVTFEEDKSTTSTGTLPRAMATYRNLIISLLRLRGWTNIAKGLRHHGRDPHRILDLLGVT